MFRTKLLNSDVRDITAFVVLTASLSAPLYVLYSHATRPGSGTYLEYLMWCPGIAALAILGLTKRSVRSIGWKMPGFRYLLLAVAVPFTYFAVSYGLIWIAGGAGSPIPISLTKLRRHMFSRECRFRSRSCSISSSRPRSAF